MKMLKLTIEFNDGSIKYIDDEQLIRKTALTVPTNSWKSGASIEALRNKYYQMLTELSKTTATGSTKLDLHEAFKPMLMQQMRDFPQYFVNQQPEYSTKHLNREGWIALIAQLKSISLDIYGHAFD
jgi:hypothetical protein